MPKGTRGERRAKLISKDRRLLGRKEGPPIPAAGPAARDGCQGDPVSGRLEAPRRLFGEKEADVQRSCHARLLLLPLWLRGGWV